MARTLRNGSDDEREPATRPGDFVSYEVFATGFMRDLNSNYNRRPVDLVVMPDGALLVSDDQAQTIYRISHTGN